MSIPISSMPESKSITFQLKINPLIKNTNSEIVHLNSLILSIKMIVHSIENTKQNEQNIICSLILFIFILDV